MEPRQHFLAWTRKGSAYASILLLAGAATGGDAGRFDLSVPPESSPDAALELRVLIGPFPRGARITIGTQDGLVIGTVAPLGVRASQSGGQYILPVPAAAIVNGHVRLQVEVLEGNAVPRAPYAGEVERMDLRSDSSIR